MGGEARRLRPALFAALLAACALSALLPSPALAALGRAAAIMAFVLWLFSIMFAASITEIINTANQLSAVTIGKLLVVCLLLCWALTKSGQFARDVLGG